MAIPKHKFAESDHHQHEEMKRFYKVQAKIYDLTRWAFLFGRKKILKRAVRHATDAKIILEIGCGTGKNLTELCRLFPDAKIFGYEVSEDMARISQRKTEKYHSRCTILNDPYTPDSVKWKGKADVILFSYSLTMINPQWKDLLKQAADDLSPAGIIAVVDFHDSSSGMLHRHMHKSNVRMEAHLLPALREIFAEKESGIKSAYAGWWRYFWFIGMKK